MYKYLIKFSIFFLMVSSCFAKGTIPLTVQDQEALNPLFTKISSYPRDVKFFENNGVQALIKKIVPAHEQKLLRVFSVETPIETGKPYADDALIVHNCKAHDCSSNYFSLFLAKNNKNDFTLVVYFYETNKQGSLGKWFTPVKACNIIKKESADWNVDGRAWLPVLRERLQCLQNA